MKIMKVYHEKVSIIKQKKIFQYNDCIFIQNGAKTTHFSRKQQKVKIEAPPSKIFFY